MAANLDTSPDWRTAAGDDVTRPDELQLFVALNALLDRRFELTQHTWSPILRYPQRSHPCRK